MGDDTGQKRIVQAVMKEVFFIQVAASMVGRGHRCFFDERAPLTQACLLITQRLATLALKNDCLVVIKY